MTKYVSRVLVATVALALLPIAAMAQTLVTGSVRGSNGTPLANAVVSIPSLRVGANTDVEGHYRFTVPPAATGQVAISVRRLGYQPSSATINLGGGSVNQDFTLQVSATEL